MRRRETVPWCCAWRAKRWPRKLANTVNQFRDAIIMKASWLDTEKQLQKFNTAELQNLSLNVFWGLVYFCYLFYSKQWHGGMKFCQALEKFRLYFLPPFSLHTHMHIETPKHIHTQKYKKKKERKKRNKYTVNVWVVIWTLPLVFFIFIFFLLPISSLLFSSPLLTLLSSAVKSLGYALVSTANIHYGHLSTP